MARRISVRIAEEGADAERLNALAGYLRSELRLLDVDDVTAMRGGEAPSGARGLDVVALGGLIVSLGSSAQTLLQLVTAVRCWLSRGNGEARRVRLELDGDVLEVTGASTLDQDQLIELFVGRHQGGDPA